MTRFACLLLLLALFVPASRADEVADDRKAILGLLAPRRGEHIADVGCGQGTWSIEFARAVGPEGRVYAVDIDPDAVAGVKKRMKEEGVGNIQASLSLPDDPGLSPDSVDAIFLNDVIDWVERPALAGFLAGGFGLERVSHPMGEDFALRIGARRQTINIRCAQPGTAVGPTGHGFIVNRAPRQQR